MPSELDLLKPMGLGPGNRGRGGGAGGRDGRGVVAEEPKGPELSGFSTEMLVEPMKGQKAGLIKRKWPGPTLCGSVG